MKNPTYIFILVLFSFLSGCSHDPTIRPDGQKITSPLTEPSQHYKIGTPYKIKGTWYYPHENYEYSETGMASWYGLHDHGDLTANGEIFDENLMTAAHRTLPLPCIVKVTNLDNNKSVILRVNDRGPFAKNRIIDVSLKASELLGFKDKGTAPVHVELLKSESLQIKSVSLGKSPKAIKTNIPKESQIADNDIKIVSPLSIEKGFFLQIASFRAYQNAQDLVKKLGAYEDLTMYEVMLKDTKFYRVILGPLKTKNEASLLQQDFLNKGYQTQIVFQPTQGT